MEEKPYASANARFSCIKGCLGNIFTEIFELSDVVSNFVSLFCPGSCTKANKRSWIIRTWKKRNPTPVAPIQPTRLTTTNAVEINRREYGVNTCLGITDPWQVVPRQVFSPYDCLLISVAFVVLCRVG